MPLNPEPGTEPCLLAAAIIGTQATRSKTVQAYEKLHKLVVEFVCVQNNLQRALVDAAAGEEVRAGSGFWSRGWQRLRAAAVGRPVAALCLSGTS